MPCSQKAQGQSEETREQYRIGKEGQE